MNRISLALTLALGLSGVACGGPDERPSEATPPTTAGMEATTPPTGQQAWAATPEAEPMERGQISDAELTAFADALIALTLLEQQGAARVQAGEPLAAVQADLQPQAQRVFEESMLTPDRFNQIAKQVDNDAALAARIQRQIETRLGAAASI